ncbi:hypothetical protein [Leptospira terpstrae]|uniref:Phage abortive infection protein n=1 Tax=Leptospira terpstrae serovar Hualin str. LT 11-33 = ATCC 700639 TaxID=1257025 RepID=N1VYA1_9LEPT|nr:hypothetical protein [Leptospira terpstrae]EMY63538.1 hypothetical protein LEP1GSC203_0412 [Leptospira terpstrae serovar Hualin str. LT 11-33 = ATCC 700639]
MKNIKHKLNVDKNFRILIIPIFTIILIFGLYILKFNYGISDEQAVWGSFGDYIGGILNPILTFITIIYLIKSHTLQIDETREIQNENRLSIYVRSLDQISNDLFEFYKKSCIIGHVEYSYLGALENILRIELLDLDLKISVNIENLEERYNKIIKNAINRLPLEGKQINEFERIFQSRKNVSMLEKFKIAKSITEDIKYLEPEHPIPKLFLIDHEILNKLFTINSKIFNKT